MPTRQNIFHRVKNVVEQTIPLNNKSIEPKANFVDDLGAESMDIVCMIMGLEDEFGGEIPQEHIQKLKTVADVVTYIETRMETLTEHTVLHKNILESTE